MRGTARRPVRARPEESAAVEAANARWYFAGLAASLVSKSAMSLVAGVWVKALTGSSAQAGLASACLYAGTLGASVSGLIADRLPRRWLLVWMNVLAATTIAALLWVASRAQLWLLFAAMGLYGIAATLMDPDEDALFVAAGNLLRADHWLAAAIVARS